MAGSEFDNELDILDFIQDMPEVTSPGAGEEFLAVPDLQLQAPGDLQTTTVLPLISERLQGQRAIGDVERSISEVTSDLDLMSARIGNAVMNQVVAPGVDPQTAMENAVNPTLMNRARAVAKVFDPDEGRPGMEFASPLMAGLAPGAQRGLTVSGEMDTSVGRFLEKRVPSALGFVFNSVPATARAAMQTSIDIDRAGAEALRTSQAPEVEGPFGDDPDVQQARMAVGAAETFRSRPTEPGSALEALPDDGYLGMLKNFGVLASAYIREGKGGPRDTLYRFLNEEDELLKQAGFTRPMWNAYKTWMGTDVANGYSTLQDALDWLDALRGPNSILQPGGVALQLPGELQARPQREARNREVFGNVIPHLQTDLGEVGLDFALPATPAGAVMKLGGAAKGVANVAPRLAAGTARTLGAQRAGDLISKAVIPDKLVAGFSSKLLDAVAATKPGQNLRNGVEAGKEFVDLHFGTPASRIVRLQEKGLRLLKEGKTERGQQVLRHAAAMQEAYGAAQTKMVEAVDVIRRNLGEKNFEATFKELQSRGFPEDVLDDLAELQQALTSRAQGLGPKTSLKAGALRAERRFWTGVYAGIVAKKQQNVADILVDQRLVAGTAPRHPASGLRVGGAGPGDVTSVARPRGRQPALLEAERGGTVTRAAAADLAKDVDLARLTEDELLRQGFVSIDDAVKSLQGRGKPADQSLDWLRGMLPKGATHVHKDVIGPLSRWNAMWGPRGQNVLTRAWNRMHSMWKPWVTSRNVFPLPYKPFRDMVDDSSRAYIGLGDDVADPAVWSQALDAARRHGAGRIDTPGGQLWQEAESLGIVSDRLTVGDRTGFATERFFRGANPDEVAARAAGGPEAVAAATNSIAQDALAVLENATGRVAGAPGKALDRLAAHYDWMYAVPRLATFQAAKKKLAREGVPDELIPQLAAAEVTKWLGDYRYMSEAGRAASSLVPFANFLGYDIGFKARSLSAVGSASRAVRLGRAQGATTDRGQTEPQHLASGTAWDLTMDALPEAAGTQVFRINPMLAGAGVVDFAESPIGQTFDEVIGGASPILQAMVAAGGEAWRLPNFQETGSDIFLRELEEVITRSPLSSKTGDLFEAMAVLPEEVLRRLSPASQQRVIAGLEYMGAPLGGDDPSYIRTQKMWQLLTANMATLFEPGRRNAQVNQEVIRRLDRDTAEKEATLLLGGSPVPD